MTCSTFFKACAAAGALCLAAMAQDNPPVVVEKYGVFVSSVSEKSLPFHTDAAIYLDTVGDTGSIGAISTRTDNAVRLLAFTVDAGETLAFALKSERWKVMMQVYTDKESLHTNSKLKAAIRKANLPPMSARAKKLEFTNTSKEPYEMVLVLFGTHGYAYDLSWERKMGKKK